MVNIKHLGIILDGNRRFSMKLMQEPWKGHEWGAKKVKEFLGWCKEYEIPEVTLYAFSMQNFNRPKTEFKYLMKIFSQELKTAMEDTNHKNVKIRFIGRINLFPTEIKNMMEQVMEKTKDNKPYKVNFAMAYGGREEILDATRDIIEDVSAGKISKEDINEALFSKYLYLESSPDLVIRTGGEIRTSNFLPWQSIYSEWFFINDKTWPEFEKNDFIECINKFSERQRRFGR